MVSPLFARGRRTLLSQSSKLAEMFARELSAVELDKDVLKAAL